MPRIDGGPLLLTRANLTVLVASLLLMGACEADRPTGISSATISSIDGKPLDSKVMKMLRAADRGCSFSIPVVSGGQRSLLLQDGQLPFQIPKVTKNATTGHGDGRALTIRVKTADIPENITVSCWVPSSMTAGDFALVASSASWKGLYARLRHAKLISKSDLARPLPREVQQLRYESLDPNPPPLQVAGISAGSALHDPFTGCTVVAAASRKPGKGAGPGALLNTISYCQCAGVTIYDEEWDETYVTDVVCTVTITSDGAVKWLRFSVQQNGDG